MSKSDEDACASCGQDPCTCDFDFSLTDEEAGVYDPDDADEVSEYHERD